MTFYSYTQNGAARTTTISTGEPNANRDAILNGSQTVTVIGLKGETQSVVTSEMVNGSPGIVLASETHQTDYLGRSTNITYLGGLVVERGYGCCDLDWETDPEGVTTNYEYDGLKRLMLTTRNNITVSNRYDALDHVISVTRIGGTNSMLQIQRFYTQAGQLAEETDAVGVSTLYTNYWDTLYGYLIKQTIYAAGTADAATRIEIYYKDGRLYELSGTAVRPLRYEYSVESDNGAWRSVIKEIKLGAGSNGFAEWTKAYMDMLGRVYKTVYPDNATQQYFYNELGQLIKAVDPDGVTALYQYNGKGEREYVALDMNRNDLIDLGGPDRITRTVADAVTNHNTNVRRTQTYFWDTPNSSTDKLISTTETSTDGLQTWETTWNNAVGVTTNTVTTYDRANHRRTVTVTAPNQTVARSVYQDGRLQSLTTYGVGGSNQLGQTTYAYDAAGRVQYVTDARNGTVTNYYNQADQVTSITTSAAVGGQGAQTTSIEYDAMRRAITIDYPNQMSVYNEYYSTSQLMRQTGSVTYPSYYTYDAQGRVTSMETWQAYSFGNPVGSATTLWTFSPQRGWLVSKTYTNGTVNSFTYTPGGRLKTRTWARGIVTTNVYGFDDGVSGNESGESLLADALRPDSMNYLAPTSTDYRDQSHATSWPS